MALNLAKYDFSTPTVGSSAQLKPTNQGFIGPVKPANQGFIGPVKPQVLGQIDDLSSGPGGEFPKKPAGPGALSVPKPTGFDDLSNMLNDNTNQQMGEIDSLYSSLQDRFNQAESSLGGQKQSALDAAKAQWEAQQAQLGTGRDQSLNRLTEQEGMVDARTQDALSRARQLYNEQLMGFNQRFGSTSSAGEASRALLGRESQRQFGDIRQEQASTLNQLQTRKNEVEQEFQSGLMQLQAAKQQAETDIRARFQQALDQINNARTSSAAEKANRKMDALQDLRNAMFNLKVEEMNAQQQLQQQAAASSQALQQAMAQFGGAVTGGEQALSQFDPNFTGLQQPTQRQTTSAQLTGSMARPEDELTGQIIPGANPLDRNWLQNLRR